MKPGTRSQASELAALCERGLVALAEGRPEELVLLADEMRSVGRPEPAGDRAEIEEALRATRRLQRAVAGTAGLVAEELGRLREGRRALCGYRLRTARAPRAVDLDA
jgi:hypothetical protein